MATDVDDNPKNEVEMSFLDHLEALRWHLMRSVIAIAGLGILAFVNRSFVFDTVLLAPKTRILSLIGLCAPFLKRFASQSCLLR